LFIEWKDDYLVGHPLIDYDHQTLVNITNELYANVQKGKGDEMIDDSINYLIGYVTHHFAREEGIFLESDYPDGAAHLQKHRDIEAVVGPTFKIV